MFLVLEVRKDLPTGRPPAQSVRNLFVLCRRVPALPESIATEGSGHNIRRLQIVTLSNAQSHLMAPQYIIGFVAKPRAVPEFKSHPQPSRSGIFEEGVEASHIRLEIGWKLEENHAHSSGSNDWGERMR